MLDYMDALGLRGRGPVYSYSNPEVAGSNPAPATNSAGQGPLLILEEGFCMRPVNGFVNAALAQVARQSRRRPASGRPMSYSTLWQLVLHCSI